MKKLIFLAILIAIFTYYKHSSKPVNTAGSNNTSADNIDVGNGFISVFMPAGSNPNEAFVLTPINCTSEEVAIGKKLEEDIRAAGIPVKKAESFRVEVENATEEQNTTINKTMDLLNAGDPPIVFLNGYAKSRPTVEEVLAVYKLTSDE